MGRAITVGPVPGERELTSVQFKNVIKVDGLLPTILEAIPVLTTCSWVVIGRDLELLASSITGFAIQGSR